MRTIDRSERVPEHRVDAGGRTTPATVRLTFMIGLHIAADDRTGALEVAGACVATGVGNPEPGISQPVLVVARPADVPATGTVVVDIGSRHLDVLAAATAAAECGDLAAGRRVAHKIDSTLRGNWAAELMARSVRAGERVLLVPAFPGAGRTCIDGVVAVYGTPVAETEAARDARRPVRSSRPAVVLRGAGAGHVVELVGGDSLRRWLAGELGSGAAPFAVCDASTDAELLTIGQAWAMHGAGVLFAGTAASIAAAAAGLTDGGGRTASGALVASVLTGPTLVVCGSLHPMARRQLDAIADTDLIVLATPEPTHLPVAEAEAAAASLTLAAAARDVMQRRKIATVVIIGGDTAAAVLGDDPLLVGGTVAPGMPWCTTNDEPTRIIVTKAGGFGTPSTLRELLIERTRG